MKSKLFVGPMLALALSFSAQAQSQKIAVISMQGAISSTKEGQKAAAELEAKAAPKKKELEQKQNDINALKDQLQKGQNTLSEATKTELMNSITQKTKTLQRDYDDASADMDQETQKVLQQLGQKVYAVIERYARDKGYVLVIDVSSNQTPVVHASPSIDITKDIIDLYDQNAPAMTNPAPSKPGLTNPNPVKPPAATPPATRPGTGTPTKPPGAK